MEVVGDMGSFIPAGKAMEPGAVPEADAMETTEGGDLSAAVAWDTDPFVDGNEKPDNDENSDPEDSNIG